MKPANFPQVIKRRIGSLSLLDLRGDLVGPWAVRAQQEIHSILENDKSSAMVLNLRPVDTIDSLGVKAVIENVVGKQRAGIIKGSSSIMSMIDAHPMKRKLRIIDNEEGLVRSFGEDMVQDNGAITEKRLFRRLKSALPLAFSCQNKEGEKLQFRAVVTNLSEGGLFAEYIDLDDIPRSQAIINPYELNLLHLEIDPMGDLAIKADGKVAHVRMEGEQVGIGIEFYDISKEAREKIHQLLAEVGR